MKRVAPVNNATRRLAPLLLSTLLLCLSSAASTAESTPDGNTSTFYRWYLAQLVANKDPLHDDAVTIRRYVCNRLLADIEKKIHSADGMDADYFIQAQDYLDDWPGNIAVTPSRLVGNNATVVVTLGASRPTQRRLNITLAKEQDAWKVCKVART